MRKLFRCLCVHIDGQRIPLAVCCLVCRRCLALPSHVPICCLVCRRCLALPSHVPICHEALIFCCVTFSAGTLLYTSNPWISQAAICSPLNPSYPWCVYQHTHKVSWFFRLESVLLATPIGRIAAVMHSLQKLMLWLELTISMFVSFT